jgi:hypothetical protein
MVRFCINAIWLCAGIACHPGWVAQAADAELQKEGAKAVGQLAGHLTDLRGRIVNAGHAAVFLCDAATGMPIHRATKQPLNPTLRDPQIDQLWVVETDDRSSFEFKDVPAGKYRIVAQSWSGTKGFPGFHTDIEPSAYVILHGVAENVEVKPDERCVAQVRQMGNHVLRIVNDPEEAHALLLISLEPTLGDGILGPYGWGKKFCRHLIGVTQMEVPHVTIMGLPENSAVHVGLMNYDNNPGCGAGSYAPGQREGRLRIVASWSNGHKDPPAELVALTDHLEKNQIAMASFLEEPERKSPSDRSGESALWKLLVKDNDRMVKVPGFGEKRLADVLAAYAYVRLRKSKR